MTQVAFDHTAKPQEPVVLVLAAQDEPHFGKINGVPVIVIAGAKFDASAAKFAELPYVKKAEISKGSKGRLVEYMQGVLVAHAAQKLVVDGIFGPASDSAARAFQKSANLVVDGRVGPRTWGALDALVTAAAQQPQAAQQVPAAAQRPQPADPQRPHA